MNSAGQTQRNQLRFGASFELTNQNHKNLTSLQIFLVTISQIRDAEKKIKLSKDR